MFQTIDIHTQARSQMLDVTAQVETAVLQSGVRKGVCTVFVPHTTAGVTINENADPDVVRDILYELDKIVPQNDGYQHCEGNSAAHIKASMMGASVQIIIQDGRLELGTWQGIYFIEFDGPRNRRLYVHVN